ncbi:MAG: M24 family metallopeptidase [Planctomycetes bacterium]|nr:M24 family metallopeptidase [Planctomycetota bacterium]
MAKDECALKARRLNAFLKKKKLDGVLLTRQDHFAWLTCGGDNHVVTASETGFGTLLYTPERKVLFATNIEAPRIMKEELSRMDVAVVDYPWHQEGQIKAKAIKKVIRGMRVASDDGVAGTKRLDGGFTELRYSLTEAEIKRYRALGKECNAAMEEIGHKVKKGQTEAEIAADICRAFIARDIQPTVCLIAADERLKYRHPIYKTRKVKKCVMIVMCGRRKGLICSLTRMVHFGRLPDELRRKHDACCAVDAAFNLSSKPGVTLGTCLKNAQSVYEATGFADEWQLHHQGGTAGYAGRDKIATPGDRTRIQPNQALAWNPSIRGTKSEDTIIAHKDRIEVISRPVNWPTIKVTWKGKTIQRADILAK